MRLFGFARVSSWRMCRNFSNQGHREFVSLVRAQVSEGINFGDGMGRCVVMVGLPYANVADPELAERMRSLELRCGPGVCSCSLAERAKDIDSCRCKIHMLHTTTLMGRKETSGQPPGLLQN